ncbi:MAG: hypothetical protein LW892_06685, partial [Betaproteobacteria bacterium]|nr:hypothetical protein [Betaproteobacteria bacterium]
MSGNELSGQVAIVTGATRKRGLGRAIALSLAQAGADVAVTGASAKGSLTEDERQEGWLGLSSVVDEIRALGRRALGVVVDVSDAAAVFRAHPNYRAPE